MQLYHITNRYLLNLTKEELIATYQLGDLVYTTREGSERLELPNNSLIEEILKSWE